MKLTLNYHRFIRDHHVPGIIGIIDGAHLFLHTPSNRKNVHSLNVQIVRFALNHNKNIYFGFLDLRLRLNDFKCHRQISEIIS